MKGIIYKYTFPDGKVYIGQTRRHPETRKREHVNKIVGPTNSGFWEAYKKYGEPKYEVLYEIELENVDELVSVLNYMETVFIHFFKADQPNFGYNKKSFGITSAVTPTIIRRKFIELSKQLSEPQLEVLHSAAEKIWKTKKPLSEEEKFLIKEKYREDNIYQEHIDSFDLDNLSNNNLEEVEFMFGEALDFVHFMITEEAGKEASRFINENYAQVLEEERSKKAIVQIDKEGNVLREFNSFNDICQAFNVPRPDNVKNVLSGKQKTAYGYFWKYKKDL